MFMESDSFSQNRDLTAKDGQSLCKNDASIIESTSDGHKVLPTLSKILWAVPKKSGKAYFRNRLRRISKAVFFEIFKKHILLNKTFQKNCLLLVFIPSSAFNSISFKERIEKVQEMLIHIQFLDEDILETI